MQSSSCSKTRIFWLESSLTIAWIVSHFNSKLFSSGDYDEDGGGGGGGAAKMANALQDGGVDKVDYQLSV